MTSDISMQYQTETKGRNRKVKMAPIWIQTVAAVRNVTSFVDKY